MLIFSDLRILDDSIYGPTVSKRLKNMDIKETKPAYRSPWQ
jgi:hypothetical protein